MNNVDVSVNGCWAMIQGILSPLILLYIKKNEGVGDQSSALMQSVYRGGLTRVVGDPLPVFWLSHWDGCVQFREKSLFLEG